MEINVVGGIGLVYLEGGVIGILLILGRKNGSKNILLNISGCFMKEKYQR